MDAWAQKTPSSIGTYIEQVVLFVIIIITSCRLRCHDVSRNTALGCVVLCTESSSPEDEKFKVDEVTLALSGVMGDPTSCVGMGEVLCCAQPCGSKDTQCIKLSSSRSSCKLTRIALVPRVYRESDDTTACTAHTTCIVQRRM
jgi:hypothetical protein